MARTRTRQTGVALTGIITAALVGTMVFILVITDDNIPAARASVLSGFESFVRSR